MDAQLTQHAAVGLPDWTSGGLVRGMTTKLGADRAEVEAAALSIEQVFALGSFEPARVQRQYVWADRECAALFSDLFIAFQNATGLVLDGEVSEIDQSALEISSEGTQPPEFVPLAKPTITVRSRPHPKSYFLGHMVLMRRPRKEGGFLIFDGQQRLTTLALLVAVIRDCVDDVILQVSNVLLQDGEPRLAIASADRSLAWMMRQPGGTRRRISSRTSVARHVNNAAALFHDRLAHMERTTVKSFLDFVLRDVLVTATFVTNTRQAQIMFETANSRGKPLSAEDILKGHIIREIEAFIPGEANSVEREWEKTRQILGESFSDFVRTVDFTRFKQERTEGLSDEILELFDGEEGAARALQFVKSEFVRYRDGFEPIANFAETDTGVGGYLALRQLSFLPWKEWQSVAMAIFIRYPINSDRASEHMRSLVKAAYTMCILGWANWPDRRAKAFGRALDQIEKGQNPFEKQRALTFRKDRRIQAKAALKAPMSESSTHGPLVRWLETLQWSEPVPREATLRATLEHVLPRAHGVEWEDVFPDENDRERCKHLLGNFCLIPSSLNRELGNSGWQQKRTAYSRLPETFKSARDVASERTWHAGIVAERTRKLADQSAKALGLD